MERIIESEFVKWADEGCTGPLAVSGIRGCGKTAAVKGFAWKRFGDFHYFDYERDGLRDILSGECTARIMGSRLEGLTDRKIAPGSTIIVDGINTGSAAARCGDALRLLASQYRVIAVGSAARFGEGFRNVCMLPMSFSEFLTASGREDLAREVESGLFAHESEISAVFPEFLAVGGLPAAVAEWTGDGGERGVDRAIRDVITSIYEDAARECGEACGRCVPDIMMSIPEQLSRGNKKFMYAKAVEGARGKDLLRPLEVLENMGAVHRVPIHGDDRECGFKLYCADTGMLRVLFGMPMEMTGRMRTGDEFSKGVMENAVLLELVKAGV